MDEQPLGEILEKALERQAEVRQAVTPTAPPSLRDLAKRDRADAYIAARRRDTGRR